MDVRTRTLSSSERKELRGFVSFWGYTGRIVLFVIILAVLGRVSLRVNQAASPHLFWVPVVVAIAGIVLFIGAKRVTGGRAWRIKVRRDLQQGEVEERVFGLSSVVVFPEIEDERPVWIFRDAGNTYCPHGQCLSGERQNSVTKDGLPRRELIITVAPNSNHTLRIMCQGDKPEIFVSRTPFHQCPLFKTRNYAKPLEEVLVDWSELLRFVSEAA